MPSARFVAAMNAANTADAPVMLLTIAHPSMGGPLRFCTGGADVVSGGRGFEARAMRIVAPGEGADAGASAVKLSIDNVTPDVVAALRTIPGGRPEVTIELVLAETPDTIEYSWPKLQLTAFRPSGDQIECDVSPRDDGEEEWPLQGFSPGATPGLF